MFTIDIAILPQKVGIFKQGIVENFQDSYDIRPIFEEIHFGQQRVKNLDFETTFHGGLYLEQTVRFSRKKEDEEKNINYFEKYYDNYHYWAPKLGRRN